jgi:PAS domain S-box-containing protein
MVAPENQSTLYPDSGGEALENLERQIRCRTVQLVEANNQLKQEIGERKRAEQITRTLFRISNAVSTTKDLDDLYASIHHILGKTIDLSNFYIAIYHKQAKRVSFPYFVDQFDSDVVYSDQFSEESSLTGEVITNQKAVFLDKEALQQRAAQNRIIGTVPKAWLGVPLKIKGEVIGIMAAQCYEEPHHFDLIDLEILNSVSDQVALAIERKRNEQALIASEKKYRNIIGSIEDGYYEINLDGNLSLVNQAMCRMLGYDENEMLGMNTSAYMSEHSSHQINDSSFSILAAEGRGKTLELQLYRKDGGTCYAETVVSAIFDEDGEPVGFRGIARDISERKQAEESRKILEEQLQRSQRLEALGTLAGGIAHDFNNLLMGIQGRTELILTDLPDNHPHSLQLRNIENYLKSAASLTSGLLGFARGGKYEIKPVDLNALIQKSIRMFGRTKKEIVIESTLHNDLPPVEADSSQIEQVFLNLLVNAGQAMPGGGSITITTRLTSIDENNSRFHDIQPGNYVSIRVSDTGKGMDEETIGKIFEPFFTTKTLGHGTGLGLATVYGIIRNHGGAIFATSALNQGTSFTLFLPASDKKFSPEIETPQAVARGSETLLLVDDEPMIIEVGRQILAALGYNVLTAASGEEALEIFGRGHDRIDLLIIDMIMPQMSGGELFDKLKKIKPTVKVLLASGYSIEGEAREILERGCAGFIQKPFTMSELSVKLRKMLVC